MYDMKCLLCLQCKDPFTLLTAPYVNSMYGVVRRPPPYRRHRTSTQDIADAKLYATYCCCQWAQLHCHNDTTQHVASVAIRSVNGV